MVFDTQAGEFVGSSRYVVSSEPSAGEVAQFETVSAELSVAMRYNGWRTRLRGDVVVRAREFFTVARRPLGASPLW